VGQILKIPVAHAEGRYHCDENTLSDIQANNQILFRYCETNGEISESGNFNGSIDNIAGIMNKNGNVFGMMPHPERASEAELGNTDGLAMLLALVGEKRALAV
jgi:phosphoribosylformylglycinamidine synthase